MPVGYIVGESEVTPSPQAGGSPLGDTHVSVL